MNLRPRTAEQVARYKNPDNHAKGPWVPGDLTANVKGGRFVESLNFAITNPTTGKEYYPPNGGNWRFSQERMQKLLSNDELFFGKGGQGAPKLKRFLTDVKGGTTWTTLWDFAPLNARGSAEMAGLFGSSTIFESPKPVGLLEYVLKAGASKDCIVMDFFAGSGTTAHAVMALNAQDGGKRRCISVQLAEETDKASEAHKAGYGTIAEFAQERIWRAGKRIKADLSDKKDSKSLDIGFRVLKIDTSNMAEVYYRPDELKQDDLLGMVDNVRPDRTAEDLLFQVLLDWGVDLALPIVREQVAGREVFFVDGDALAACFVTDGSVDEDFVKALAERKPLRAVFRDSGFANDNARINVEQIFKAMSPTTEVKTI